MRSAVTPEGPDQASVQVKQSCSGAGAAASPLWQVLVEISSTRVSLPFLQNCTMRSMEVCIAMSHERLHPKRVCGVKFYLFIYYFSPVISVSCKVRLSEQFLHACMCKKNQALRRRAA